MTILLVEDDDVIAEFVSGGLQEAGYAVERVPDGEEGLRLGLERDFDAAVVDVMLPRRDGLSLVEELRRRGRRTPVLFLSARRTVDDRVRGLHSGGDDYLVKPFDFSELLARLQALRSDFTSRPGTRVSSCSARSGSSAWATCSSPAPSSGATARRCG
jgi:two-component system OmpR family response regulator